MALLEIITKTDLKIALQDIPALARASRYMFFVCKSCTPSLPLHLARHNLALYANHLCCEILPMP